MYVCLHFKPLTTPLCQIFIEKTWSSLKTARLSGELCYSFNGLKENLPKGLDSAPIQAIRRWEHWLFCWVDAYWVGLGSVEAQLQVKTFSSGSRQYKSHRRLGIPENIATLFDWCTCLVFQGRQFGSSEKKNSLNFWLNKNSSGHYFPTIKICRLHRGLTNLVFFQRC